MSEAKNEVQRDSANLERVVMLRPEVTHRCCPDCGYIMTQLEIDLIRIVVDCPRGCGRTINEFQPMNMTT
jgi:hypothetical protein